LKSYIKIPSIPIPGHQGSGTAEKPFSTKKENKKKSKAFILKITDF